MTEPEESPQPGAVSMQATISRFELGGELVREDLEKGLKYVLLRLSTLGLTTEDQVQLRDIARQAAGGADVREAAAQLAARSSASPLAELIASLLDRGFGDPKKLLLGALFGAYTVLNQHNSAVVLQAAVAGALAAAGIEFTVRARIEEWAWRQLVD